MDKQPFRSEWSPGDHAAVQIQANYLCNMLFFFFVHHSGLSQHPLLTLSSPSRVLPYLFVHARLPAHALTHTRTPARTHAETHTKKKHNVSSSSLSGLHGLLPHTAFFLTQSGFLQSVLLVSLTGVDPKQHPLSVGS